jgi:hypothetical protein
MNLPAIEVEINKAFNTPIAGIIPFSEEVILLGSSGLFAQLYQDHPITNILQQILGKIEL